MDQVVDHLANGHRDVVSLGFDNAWLETGRSLSSHYLTVVEAFNVGVSRSQNYTDEDPAFG